MNGFHMWIVKIARKPRIQRWLVHLAREIGLYGTLDTEAALREKNHKIIELEEALASRPIVYIHTGPLLAVGAPLPQTTGPIPLGARYRAFRRQLNDQPSGKMLRIDTDMRHRKQITGTLDVETQTLPAIPKPPGQGAITRDLRKLTGDNPPPFL